MFKWKERKTALIWFLSAKDDLDPRISSMYEQVGEILSHYRSGKIPKAFKILPNLANWEQVSGTLCVPQRWHSTLVRFFSSHNPIVGQPRRCTRRLDSLPRTWTLKWLKGKLHSFSPHTHRSYPLIISGSTISSCFHVCETISMNTRNSIFSSTWSDLFALSISNGLLLVI